MERYANDIEQNYGHYNWDSPIIEDFCHTHNIKKKNNQKANNINKYFWFSSSQKETLDGKINDKAWHFLRHIRNAIAHGYIKKEKKNIIVKDYEMKRNGLVMQTMQGQLPADVFWNFVDAVESTKH